MNGAISIGGRYNLMSSSNVPLGNTDSKDKNVMEGDTIDGSLVRYIDGIDNDCNNIASRDNCINASSDIYT
jgi:hypothetical protein